MLMKVFLVVLLSPQNSAEVFARGTVSDLLLGAFAMAILLTERDLLAKMRFVLVFQRLSLEWSELLIRLVLRFSWVD